MVVDILPELINSTAFNGPALFIVYDEGQKHDKSGFGSGTYAVTGGRLFSSCKKWICFPTRIHLGISGVLI